MEGRIAFLYPGQGSQHPGMLEELTLHFGELRERLEQADRTLAGRMSDPLSGLVLPGAAFTPQERADQVRDLTRTAVAQPALGAAGLGVTALLASLGVVPDLLAGHSYGEWVALCAAGAFDETALYRLSEARGRAMAEACPPGHGTMAAVAAPVAAVTAALDGLTDVWVANVNGPRQTVVSGTTDGIAAAVERLAREGLDTTRLDVSAAFHSPLMESATRPLADAMAEEDLVPPERTVLAGTTGQPYRTSRDVTHELLDQLTSRVRFTDVVERLYDEGARVFVEAGPRQVLTGLVRQVLADREHLAVAVDQDGGGLVPWLRTLGALAAAGVPVDAARLFRGRELPLVRTDRLVPDTVPAPPAPTAWWVTGGSCRPAREPERTPVPVAPPPVQMSPPATTTQGGPPMTSTRAPHQDAGTVIAAHQQVMASFLASHERVMLACLQAGGGVAPVDLPAQEVDAEWIEPSLPQLTVAPTAPTTEVAPSPAAPTAPEPTAVAAETTPPPDPRSDVVDDASLTATLIELIGERTGYPIEVIGAETDLQGELGIDSIKKVEILGMFQRAYGFGTADKPSAMESLSGVRTPREAVEVLLALVANGASGNGNGAPARFVPVAEGAP